MGKSFFIFKESNNDDRQKNLKDLEHINNKEGGSSNKVDLPSFSVLLLEYS